MDALATPMTADAKRTGPRSRPLARRAGSYASSPWVEIAAYGDRHPDMVSFGSGAPAPELTPLDRLREAAAGAWAATGGRLGYGDVAGHRPLRDLIAARMAAQGATVDPAHLLLTNGSQGGIDLIARLFLDPGDPVVVEAPTYIGALQVFDAFEATYLPAPLDGGGLDVAALDGLLRDLPRPPKLLYTVPTFQNPTGVTMSAARRAALVELARRHDLLVVEDDPYGELWYDAPPPPPLRAQDPGVVYLGTFSKTIAPGLRVGWMAAPPDLVEPLLTAREAADIHNERVTARIVRAAADGFLDGHLVGARALYRRRRDALLAGLAAHMPPGVRWVSPGGGFFVWVRLPDGAGPGVTAAALLPRAAAAGALFIPGSLFFPDRSDPRSLRLSFSTLPEERIEEGTRRLGQAVSALLDEV